MKVKVKKSDYSIVPIGLIGEAIPMPYDFGTQGVDWFEVTIDKIPNPVPGYKQEGQVILAFKREQLEFLEDDKETIFKEDKSVEDLIQVMRTCSLAKVRKELENLKEGFPDIYIEICNFYLRASTLEL